MPREKKPPPPEPRTCETRACRFCRTLTQREFLKPRALTTDDLVWQFGQAEAAMGLRSTHGAFVDMAQSGIQGGGKSNGVEARAVEDWRLAAVARHRCIRARLAHLTPSQLDVLRAAFGPDDWTRAIEDLQVRNPVRSAFGALVSVAVLAPAAQDRAARRQAPHKPAGEATATTDDHGAVRCAYRPSPPPPRPKERPSQRRRHALPSDAARALFARDPALAGSPRGVVIAAACSEDPRARETIVREARAMLDAARAAAGVVEQQASRRVRAVQLVEPARPRLASEVLGGG